MITNGFSSDRRRDGRSPTPHRVAALAISAALVALTAAGASSSNWIHSESERPSAGALSWDNTSDMHQFYLESFSVGAAGGSAAHTIGEVPWLQLVEADDDLYEIDAVQLIGLEMLGGPVVYPSTRVDRVDWRSLTPVEFHALARLRAGEEVVDLLTEDRPRVIGAVRNTGACTNCHDGGQGKLLGALSYQLKWPDDGLTEYEEFVALLEEGKTVSLVALRWAFTRWKGYHPEMTLKFARHYGEMIKAMQRDEFDWVADHCNKALRLSYVDVATHDVCANAYRESGDARRAGFHELVSRGLVAALLASGDGTEEHPYIAVTFREIAILLAKEGLESDDTEHAFADGESYELHYVTNETGEQRTVWFRTTVMEEWISQNNR